MKFTTGEIKGGVKMHTNSIAKLILTISILVWISCVSGLIYVAIHFISKYW
jgi:hypothetical protein